MTHSSLQTFTFTRVSVQDAFKPKKRTSIKRFFSAKDKNKENGLHRSTSVDVERGDVISESDVNAMIADLPTDELDLVHFVIGHGILRRDMR